MTEIDINQIISLNKTILWEEIKGRLRALVAIGGHIPSVQGDYEIKRYEEIHSSVEKFIDKFESDGFDE